MGKKLIFTSILTFIVLSITVNAQQKKYPLIQSGGAMYEVPEAVPMADTKMKYKVIVELSKPADKPDSVNASLDKLTRLVNLHIAAGIPKENIDVVGVIHFLGTPMVLDDEAYQKKFGMVNPNTKLINELAANGVKFYVCGQSLRARKLADEKRNPNIKVAQSALLVLTTLQLKGYAVINP
jgi:intracellular sulfur oxidation DsrE/DsrF family protein